MAFELRDQVADVIEHLKAVEKTLDMLGRFAPEDIFDEHGDLDRDDSQPA